VACPLASAAVREPYKWYPALDLARIPFHAGDGPWGKRARITAPTAPVTQRSVTVNSADELIKAALTPGTEITVGRSIDRNVVLMGDVTDVDLIVPPGVRLRGVAFGSYNPPSATRRLRVRGRTPMSHSGGSLGTLEFYSQTTSDVIIDGVDLNGEDGQGGNGLYTFREGAERIAIVNVRGRSVGWGSGDGGSTDLVVAGCNILTGERSREANGYDAGWGSRGGNRVVFFRNYLEGTRFHRIRLHPANATQYAWVVENVFVDPYEARILTVTDVGGTVPGTHFAAFWAQCNLIVAHSTCMDPSFEAPSAVYAELTHNVFRGSFTRERQADLQSQHGARHDYLTGNSFDAWSAPPPYPPPGNPRAVPLPADDPGDDNLALMAAPCPGP
jgi:hypothetical protein